MLLGERLFNGGVPLPLSHKALIGEVLRQQFLYCRVSPITAAEAFDSLRVVIGVIVASLVVSSYIVTQFVRTACSKHVPYSFHFLMMDVTELRGMFGDLEMFCICPLTYTFQ